MDYQEEVINLCKEKGFPLEKEDTGFLLARIQIELAECFEAHHQEKNEEHLKEELIDVLIQTIQAVSALDGNVEELFNIKMNINKDREWRK